jgi:hypothetical protein
MMQTDFEGRRSMPAVVIQNLAFDLGPRKLVVFRTDRRDLPHLTLSWNNPTGEIDLHLTPAKPKNANDRDSIARFQQAELILFFESLGQRFGDTVAHRLLKLFRPIKPDWLRKNHYKLYQPEGGSLEEWLRKGFPKSRNKYRADPHLLRRMPKACLRQPTSMRLAEAKHESQVWAVCVAGWNRGHVFVLHYLNWPHRASGWTAIDYEDSEKFVRLIKNVFPGHIDDVLNEKYQIVCNALQLREIGWAD